MRLDGWRLGDVDVQRLIRIQRAMSLQPQGDAGERPERRAATVQLGRVNPPALPVVLLLHCQEGDKLVRRCPLFHFGFELISKATLFVHCRELGS